MDIEEGQVENQRKGTVKEGQVENYKRRIDGWNESKKRDR